MLKSSSKSSHTLMPEVMEQETYSEESVTSILTSLSTLLTQQASLITALTRSFAASCSRHRDMVTVLKAQIQGKQESSKLFSRSEKKAKKRQQHLLHPVER
jgi:hypothetical protein